MQTYPSSAVILSGSGPVGLHCDFAGFLIDADAINFIARGKIGVRGIAALPADGQVCDQVIMSERECRGKNRGLECAFLPEQAIGIPMKLPGVGDRADQNPRTFPAVKA